MTSWLAAKKDWPALAEALGKLVDRYMEGALEFKRLNCRELVPTDRLSCVRTFTRLMDAVTTAENGLTPDLAPEALAGRLEPWFQFCLVWGLGGPLDEAGRKKFDGFMRWAAGRCSGLLRPATAAAAHQTRPAAHAGLRPWCRDVDSKLPGGGETIFEYFVDPKAGSWASWETKLSGTFKPPADVPPFRVSQALSRCAG